MSKKQIITYIACFSLFLVVFLVLVDRQKLIELITNANLFLFILAFLFYLFSCIIRGVRWKYILSSTKSVSALHLFKLEMVGYLANCVIPARGGDVVRAYVLNKSTAIKIEIGLLSIVVEKIFDGATLILLFFLSVFAFNFTNIPGIVKYSIIVASIIFLAIIIFLVLSCLLREKILVLVSRIARKFLKDNYVTKITLLLDSAIKSISLFMHTPKKVKVIVISCSMIIWMIQSLVFYLSFLALGLSLPIHYIIIGMIMINLVILLPSSPGQIGTFEGAGFITFVGFGVSKDIALAGVMLTHIVYLIGASTGALFLSSLGIKQSDFKYFKKMKISAK